MASPALLLHLPLSIFSGLISQGKNILNSNDLRSAICNKLKEIGRKPGSQQLESITTVGQLLRMTPPALLRALDPLLTHGKIHSQFILFLKCNKINRSPYRKYRLLCPLNSYFRRIQRIFFESLFLVFCFSMHRITSSQSD